MNREILFKAKTTKKNDLKHEFNEKWVEGNLILCGGEAYIHPVSNKIDVTGEIGKIIVMHEADPETLCQFTGLTDKNGKKIWENDILRGYQYPYRYDGNDNYFAEVTWFENCSAFGIYTFKNPKSNVCGISEGNTEFMENWNSEDWEVIGNIFDNVDLLEVK